MTEIYFKNIRDDWYKANQLLPRLVRKALQNPDSICFRGFPRQWIPFFENCGLTWRDCVQPREHMPMISEFSDEELLNRCRSAQANGTLRTMIESVAALDP